MTRATRWTLLAFIAVLAFALGTWFEAPFTSHNVRADADLHWDHAGSDLYTVAGISNVGIGTTSPEEQLHIFGSSSGAGDLLFENSNQDGSGEIKIKNDTGALFKIGTVGSNFADTDAATRTSYLITDNSRGLRLGVDNAAGELRFYTGGIVSGNRTLTMFPNGNVSMNRGNIGIGTDSPEEQLHIFSSSPAAGDLLFENSSQDGSGEIKIRNDAGELFKLGTVGSNFSDTGAATRTSYLITDNSRGLRLGVDNANGEIRFFSGGIGAANERVRISNAGNVGIGTQGPTEKLQVQGNIKLSGNITSDGEICIGSGCP